MKKKIGDQEVEISHKILDDGTIEIQAICGEHSHGHRITIGAADQPLPAEYDQAQAQKDLDEGRAYAAAMAASKARRKLLTDGLQ